MLHFNDENLVAKHKKYFIDSILGTSQLGLTELSGVSQEIGCKTRIQGESKRTDAFIFKLAAKLLLEIDNSSVYSPQDVATIVRKNVQILGRLQLHFNVHSELHLCFRLINGSLI